MGPGIALVACLWGEGGGWGGLSHLRPGRPGREAREEVPEAEAQHQAQRRQPELTEHCCVQRACVQSVGSILITAC